MEQNVVLLPYMEQIVSSVTKQFRKGFDLVRYRIQEAARFPEIEPGEFYWLAAPDGIRIVPEREVYFRGSFAYQRWTCWANKPGITACRIKITGIRNGRIIGSVQAFDYTAQVKRIMFSAIPAVKVKVLFYSGEQIEVTPEFLQVNLEQLFLKKGTARCIYHYPENELNLLDMIAAEHRRQELDSL